ncbi:MAG: tetratricopeptide repeat protein [Bryobacteraceae bacterium]|jgi:tetratricopeptide (TPR) repeat protein
MKRTFLTGVLVTAAVVSGLMAQVKPKSKAEAEAIRALHAARTQGPDAIIKAAEDLVGKFADTAYKQDALLLEADSYLQKGDYATAEITDQRVLEAYPKNPQAGMQLGELILQHVGENDLDKDEQLSKAEKDFNQALANIDTNPYSGVQDAKWEKNKKFTLAELQNDLGLVAMKRKQYDAAIADFKSAVDGDPQPAFQARLALAYQQAGKNDAALAVCDKLLADPQLNPAIRQVAESVKTMATQAKRAGRK